VRTGHVQARLLALVQGVVPVFYTRLFPERLVGEKRDVARSVDVGERCLKIFINNDPVGGLQPRTPRKIKGRRDADATITMSDSIFLPLSVYVVNRPLSLENAEGFSLAKTLIPRERNWSRSAPPQYSGKTLLTR